MAVRSVQQLRHRQIATPGARRYLGGRAALGGLRDPQPQIACAQFSADEIELAPGSEALDVDVAAEPQRVHLLPDPLGEVADAGEVDQRDVLHLDVGGAGGVGEAAPLVLGDHRLDAGWQIEDAGVEGAEVGATGLGAEVDGEGAMAADVDGPDTGLGLDVRGEAGEARFGDEDEVLALGNPVLHPRAVGTTGPGEGERPVEGDAAAGAERDPREWLRSHPLHGVDVEAVHASRHGVHPDACIICHISALGEAGGVRVCAAGSRGSGAEGDRSESAG